MNQPHRLPRVRSPVQPLACCGILWPRAILRWSLSLAVGDDVTQTGRDPRDALPHRLVAAAWADRSDTALPCCPLSVVASALLKLSLPPAARHVTFSLTEPCPPLPRSGGLALDR